MFFFAVDVKAFWWLASARRQLSRVVGRRELRQERFGGSLRREGSFRESWVREKLVAVFRWLFFGEKAAFGSRVVVGAQSRREGVSGVQSYGGGS